MALEEELKAEVRRIFATNWDERDGRVVPEPEDVSLDNEAVNFERATVLYADLRGSTSLVNANHWWFAAEVYRTYLYCAAKVIRDEGGEITAYDGDRVMGLFIGDMQSTSAARCALKINYAVESIINPALEAQYTSSSYQVQHVIGIDTSPIRAARIGVRGGNDLVWVGRAANYAAKLAN
jgi:class 3 adenylate cyclase